MLSKNNFFILSLLLFCSKIVAGGEVRITSVSEFKNFVNKVNSGTNNFSGTIIYLDSDLSLSEETLEPIGNTSSNYFLGVFDGQGHVISDLKMNSSSQYAGLFGYSNGLTIRNIVLDSSCSITKSYSGSGYKVFVGGIIGYCYAISGGCNIENSMNMADVTFSGYIGSIMEFHGLYLGGIVGQLYSFSSYPIFVKNCANYGSVTHSGTSNYSYIGGIVGWLDDLSSNYKYIYNCLNYGTITHSGTTTGELYIGGTAGYSGYQAYIENCVSAGKILSNNITFVGSVVGYVDSDFKTYINYCYYTSDLSEYDLYGYGTPASSSYTLSYDNTTFELNGTVSVGSYTGTSLVDALNSAADYYFLRGYSKWLLNKEKKNVNFAIGSRTSPITMNYQIVLLPSLPSKGSLMFGWYNDAKCTNPLKSFEVIEDTTLYGRFEENTNNYTITFDSRKEGIYFAPITARFGATVSLPSKFVEGQCGVAFWETEYGDNAGLSLIMPAHNFTLYAVWKCTHLVTLGDFIEFADKVNSGKDDFNGITVLLDSDLSFSDKTLKSIGDDYNYFRGVFDGQGHVISDLIINSSTQYAGLFGHSNGLTIRNVVLDSSCSITSSDDAGGIIGYCISFEKSCIIENSVNMADVTFNGKISGDNYMNLGGIAGELYSLEYPSYVKNCANYGSITHSGTSSYSYIGGIAGEIYGLNIHNCINYGTITHSGTSNELYLGGIAGESGYAHIENCVSAGKISSNNITFVGSVVGYVDSDSKTYIKYCFYTSDVGEYPINGSGSPIIDDETSQAEVNATLVNKLNSYASKSNWNKWLLNANNASITFKVNDNAGFTVNSQIILLPYLVDNDERSFRGWYTDAMLTSPFKDNEVNTETTLYGVFCGVTNYIVTFDANGGNSLPVPTTTVTFNSTYGTLPEAEKPGCMFMGWFTEKADGTKVTSETIVTIPNNHTIYAHWDVPTNQVEVVFSKKDLSKDDVEKIIKKYVDGKTDFEIEIINGIDETKVIIKFADAEKAVEFVRNVNELSKNDGNNMIKRVNFVSSDNASFSPMLYPVLSFVSLVM